MFLPIQAISGVVAFFDHRDIAGKNSCVKYNIDEPIFSEGKIEYAGQALGVIVAESADLARRAALAVKISYKNREKPVLTIKEAIQEPTRIRKATEIPPLPEDIGKQQCKSIMEIFGMAAKPFLFNGLLIHQFNLPWVNLEFTLKSAKESTLLFCWFAYPLFQFINLYKM